jgi:hypothetical protein
MEAYLIQFASDLRSPIDDCWHPVEANDPRSAVQAGIDAGHWRPGDGNGCCFVGPRKYVEKGRVVLAFGFRVEWVLAQPAIHGIAITA